LAAIANSDGTRKGVTDTIFSGSGISIPATTSVLGKIVNIDPSTGDTSAKDVTIKIVKDGQETTVKAQTVN
jgi:branched-chain amino acid transport system substrate-binding protein